MIYHQQFCSQDIKDEFPCTVGAVRTKPLAPFHTRAVTTPATTPLETAASYALLELRGYLHRSEPEIWRNVMAWNVMCTCIHICPYIYIYVYISPFRLDPRGWEPHFVATERRPQGALLTSWQNPTFTEEGFCYKMAVQADP